MFAAVLRTLAGRSRPSTLTEIRDLSDDEIEHLADELCGTDLHAWNMAQADEEAREAA